MEVPRREPGNQTCASFHMGAWEPDISFPGSRLGTHGTRGSASFPAIFRTRPLPKHPKLANFGGCHLFFYASINGSNAHELGSPLLPFPVATCGRSPPHRPVDRGGKSGISAARQLLLSGARLTSRKTDVKEGLPGRTALPLVSFCRLTRTTPS